jgi:hypothetical protein
MSLKLGTTTPSKLYVGASEVTKAYYGASEVYSAVAFAPTDLPELELWLDANSGVFNSLGNNFTDATADIYVVWPGVSGGQVVFRNSQPTNGKNAYGSSTAGVQIAAYYGGANWVLWAQDVSGEEVYDLGTISASLGDEQYPWQASFEGATVTRIATTFDVPAGNDEAVVKWNNLVSGKPNLGQSSAGLQPTFKSDVYGRKAVFFNGDTLYGTGFATFGQQYSYYLVATSLGAPGGSLSGAIRLGTSSLAIRGLFGASASAIGASNGSARQSTISPSAISGAIWSARFNASTTESFSGLSEVVVGKDKSFATLTGIGTATANRSDILLGAATSTGSSSIASNYSEVLVYRAFHDEATANQIVDYLAAKWGITL